MAETPVPPAGCYNPIVNPYIDAPIETITPPYVTGYDIRANQIFVFPVTVAANTRVIFNVMHTYRYKEDFTIGCWFSTQPNVPVLFYPNHTYDCSLLRINQGFCLQDINYTGSMGMPPAAIRTILVEPGNYFYNIKNRVNGLNHFEFLFQTVELT